MKNSVCGKDNCCHNPAQCAAESNLVSTLPGLPAPKAEITSVEALNMATTGITEALDAVINGMRVHILKYAEDIKALEPLFEKMSLDHQRRALAFMEASGNGLGDSLMKELSDAFK